MAETGKQNSATDTIVLLAFFIIGTALFIGFAKDFFNQVRPASPLSTPSTREYTILPTLVIPPTNSPTLTPTETPLEFSTPSPAPHSPTPIPPLVLVTSRPTVTYTPRPLRTSTPVPTRTITPSPTVTSTITVTPTFNGSETVTATATPTITMTMTASPTATVTPTITITPIVGCYTGTPTGLPVTADTIIASASPNANYASNTDLTLIAGPTNTQHALMLFSPSQYPAGTTISSGKIYLHISSTSPGTTVFIHKLKRGFTEAEANWINAAVNQPWTTSGGDYDPIPLTSFQAESAPCFIALDITSLAQSWVSGSASNPGLILILTGPDGATVVFSAKENTTAENRPLLSITTPTP